MTKPAVIQAQLVDMRNVGTHKSLKLTLHIAQEFALEAIKAFGWPTMVDPVPVALAHLNPETMKEVMPDTGTTLPAARTNDTSPASGPDIPARAYKPVYPDKWLAQKAALLCKDEMFHRFVERQTSTPKINEDDAAAYLRSQCNVNSRSEIIPGTSAVQKFLELKVAFNAWRDADKYVEASA